MVVWLLYRCRGRVGTLAAVRELLGRGARVAHLLALHGLEALVGERLHVALRRRELTTCRAGHTQLL